MQTSTLFFSDVSQFEPSANPEQEPTEKINEERETQEDQKEEEETEPTTTTTTMVTTTTITISADFRGAEFTTATSALSPTISSQANGYHYSDKTKYKYPYIIFFAVILYFIVILYSRRYYRVATVEQDIDQLEIPYYFDVHACPEDLLSNNVHQTGMLEIADKIFYMTDSIQNLSWKNWAISTADSKRR